MVNIMIENIEFRNNKNLKLKRKKTINSKII
jgi:hypothetical protein